MSITRERLLTMEGKTISEFCPNGFTGASTNHCAHFVSHVLDFSFGYTCDQETGVGESGANIRVHQVFARCPEVGKWAQLGSRTTCLVFIIQAGNVNLRQKQMSNVPKKHVGIYVNGTIWHYSNKRDKVVSQTPAEFRQHYSGEGFALFFGTFPQ